jgi:hypothetical protein
MQCAMILEADYFFDNPTHTPKGFRRRFWTNIVFFKKIVYGLMTTSYAKNTTHQVALFPISSEMHDHLEVSCMWSSFKLYAYIRMSESTCQDSVQV